MEFFRSEDELNSPNKFHTGLTNDPEYNNVSNPCGKIIVPGFMAVPVYCLLPLFLKFLFGGIRNDVL